MKHIIKNQEHTEFTQWKSGKTTTKWERLAQSPHVKAALHQSLMQEQGMICCYCETALVKSYSHIEHFVPRSLDASLTFDYNNLLCSCQVNVERGTPLTCGNAKGNISDKNIISPLEADCATHFTFSYDGIIKGKDIRGQETIKILNLNEPNLVDKRKELIETFTDMFNDEDCTEEDFSNYVQTHLSQDAHGHFNEFWTTINYLFAS